MVAQIELLRGRPADSYSLYNHVLRDRKEQSGEAGRFVPLTSAVKFEIDTGWIEISFTTFKTRYTY